MNKITDPLNQTFSWKKITHKKYKYKTTRLYHLMLRFKPLANINGRYYQFLTNGYLLICKDYVWDGASGPTLDTKNTMRASCVHDVLYQMIREQKLRLEMKDNADKELARIMEEDWKACNILTKTWNKVRSSYYYWGVRLFGRWSCVPGSQKPT